MNGQSSWTAVAKEQDLLEGKRLEITAHGLSILLIKYNGLVYAVGNHCPHLGCSMARGKMDDFLLICPCHDWTFDIRTGELVIAREITLPTYRVRIESQQIYLQIV
jgi:nitrite reductase/ring-hydroxylating ferredoxin subunit